MRISDWSSDVCSSDLVGLAVDGGLGNDRLIWENTQNGTGIDVGSITYWERIDLTFNSVLTFKNYSTLTLGDPGTQTGNLGISNISSVQAGGGTHEIGSTSCRDSVCQAG